MFHNTATEIVKIEMEMTRNGAPFSYDSNGINCSNLAVRKVQNTIPNPTKGEAPIPVDGVHDIPEAVCYIPYETYGRKKDDPDYAYMFSLGPDVSDFGTQYCARFRARRVTDQVVSENWSNYACYQTPAKPPLPPRPDFGVTFSGSQAYLPGTQSQSDATLGQSAKLIPSTVTITSGLNPHNITEYHFSEPTCRCLKAPNNPNVLDFLTWPSDDGGSDAAHTVTVPITPAQDRLTFNLCAENYSGKTCTMKTYSTLTQSQVIAFTPKASDLRLPLKTPPPSPSPSPPPFAAAAAARLSPLQGALAMSRLVMPGVDLPGNDYSGKPISGTAVDCERACGLDGKCVAWTWVKPGVQNTQAMCWLKNTIPASRPNVNTTSGIKGGTAVH